MSRFLSIDECRDHARNVAIALNNSGIMLLRRQEHTRALETFRDAVVAMKIATSKTDSLLSRSEEVSHELLHVSQRADFLANLSRDSADGLRLSHTNASPTDSTAVLSILAASSIGTSSVLLPILIDSREDEPFRSQGIHMDSSNIDLESCIIIRNYGLSHASFANSSVEPSVKKLHLEKSYHLFTLANTVFLNLIEDITTEWNEYAPLFELLLTYDLLQMSMRLELDRYQVAEHHEYFEILLFWMKAATHLLVPGRRAAPAA